MGVLCEAILPAELAVFDRRMNIPGVANVLRALVKELVNALLTRDTRDMRPAFRRRDAGKGFNSSDELVSFVLLVLLRLYRLSVFSCEAEE